MQDSTKLILITILGISLLSLWIMCIVWLKDNNEYLWAFLGGSAIGVMVALRIGI